MNPGALTPPTIRPGKMIPAILKAEIFLYGIESLFTLIHGRSVGKNRL